MMVEEVMTIDKKDKYLVIGAGPSGLCSARNLQKYNIPFDGVEGHSDVGGLWNINNPKSTMYNSAHLISSKKMTEFKEYPMKDSVADYPHHSEMCAYFQDYANHFGLKDHYMFNTRVESVERPQGSKDGWLVKLSDGQTYHYKGIVIANGTLSEPNIPKFKGEFTGEFLHSSAYKKADIFEGKRVLIIGAGNSGCDIAVDAVHRAAKVDISVRRGYHFVPKYIFGKPADAVGGRIKLPAKVKQKVDGVLLKAFTGDPVRFGFPEPDYKLYESHPIVNSLILHHLGHGDLSVKKNIDHFEGKTVHFVDGTSQEYDMVMLATGYKLHYPFMNKKDMNWTGSCPDLYLNIFHPQDNDLFVVGMIEASGIGWEGRNEQAELMATFIKSLTTNPRKAAAFTELKRRNADDMTGGMNYLKLDRMAYYVHKDTYRKSVGDKIRMLEV